MTGWPRLGFPLVPVSPCWWALGHEWPGRKPFVTEPLTQLGASQSALGEPPSRPCLDWPGPGLGSRVFKAPRGPLCTARLGTPCAAAPVLTLRMAGAHLHLEASVPAGAACIQGGAGRPDTF